LIGIQKNATFEIQEREYSDVTKKDSHFICDFNSFGNEKSFYNLSLSFVSLEGVILLTKSDSQGKIFVKNKSVVISSTFISKFGFHTLGPLKAFKFEFPTNIYSNYTYSLKLFDRGVHYDLVTSQSTEEIFFLKLIDITNYFSIWENVVKEMQLDLFVNDFRMFTLDSKISFYGKILSINSQIRI
jgi:hypothetical protein